MKFKFKKRFWSLKSLISNGYYIEWFFWIYEFYNFYVYIENYELNKTENFVFNLWACPKKIAKIFEYLM